MGDEPLNNVTKIDRSSFQQDQPPRLDKREAMSQIRAAKSAHMRWRAYAQALVSGVEVSDEKIPVKHTNCVFGQWYHGQGKIMLGHLDSYEGIYTPHEMLHAIYERIYNTLHGEAEVKTGGLARLCRGKAARKEKQYELAREYMGELIGVSETLLKALEMLEQEVREYDEP